MSVEDAKKFYKVMDFLRWLREYLARNNLNYIDELRLVEMFVRRAYYAENK